MSLYSVAVRIAALREAKVKPAVARVCVACGSNIGRNDVIRLSLYNRSWEWTHLDCSQPEKPVEDDWGVCI